MLLPLGLAASLLLVFAVWMILTNTGDDDGAEEPPQSITVKVDYVEEDDDKVELRQDVTKVIRVLEEAKQED